MKIERKALLIGVVTLLLVPALLVGCAPEEVVDDPVNEVNENNNNNNEDVVQPEATWPVWDLRDGDYRGHFDDREHNVSVQITLENEEIVDVSLRWAYYDGIDYRAAEDEPFQGIYQQHVESLEYLIGATGKDEIVERLGYMEGRPTGPALEAIETEEIDGFTAATIRSAKLASAVRDAFNRGRYRE